MKRVLLFAFVFVLALAACGTPADSSPSEQPSEADTASVSVPASTPLSTPPLSTPTPLSTPAATPFGETPDSAGGSGILFDIYQHRAEADLNADGTAEQIEFTAGSDVSTLSINGASYPVQHADLAQFFAITDLDTSDSILELCFTDEYYELADSEEAYSYLYWWNGTDLKEMGFVAGLKFDGAWRADLHPADFFDGQGLVQYVMRTTHLTDVWYMGHFYCDGSDRLLKEDYYTSAPLYDVEPLTLKTYLVLLKKIDSDYFGSDYSVVWDYASGYALLPRDHSDDIVSFIPQEGETLTVVRVYGQYWFKLQASDGKSGWLKCVDGKIQGVYQVMGWEASDIFDGIVMAG